MNTLVKFIQENPYVVLIVFALSVLSAVVSIISGWSAVTAFMGKRFLIPTWAITMVFTIVLIILLRPASVVNLEDEDLDLSKDDPNKYVKYEAKNFGDERLVLDGKSFIKCDFKGTRLVIKGVKGFKLEGCRMEGIQFVYGGPAARTLLIISDLYKDPSMKEIVDDLFENMKQDQVPVHRPPTQIN